MKERVGVEQDQVVARRRFHGQIVRAGEPQVHLAAYEQHRNAGGAELLLNHFCGVIGGCVIDHQDLGA